ncbi:MAG: ADP-ribosylglycohydrolase family protein [Akkermansiaceae bacterium]
MNMATLRDQIMGCWIGKGIGGTLGMPFEGCAGPLDVTLDQMAGRMLPNDDLDLQLLWIRVLEQRGLATRAADLSQAAADHYACYPDEYGIARWNSQRGLVPPLTGSHNNRFGDGMGGAIRSEIWACVAPGRPKLAAALAREDALIDHHGDGVWAEMFLAALESDLFTSRDLRVAIRAGLDVIPADSRLARGLQQVLQWHCDGLTWDETRRQTLREFGSHNFTDVTVNLCFILIGLLFGEGDFERSIKLSINCGMDTDCTGATCGSILGILHGASGLSPRLRGLAGTDVVFHSSLAGLSLPATLDELTERTLRLQSSWAAVADGPLEGATPEHLPSPDDGNEWLIFRASVEESVGGEPAAVSAAEKNPAGAKECLHRVNGIHLDLTDRVWRPGDTLYLLTWLQVESSSATRLMCCADAGLTVWLDGREIINYHGRRQALPAFHRTEGGATVPVNLVPGRAHSIKIRLLTGSGPLNCTLAIGDDQGRYVYPVSLSIPTSVPLGDRA